MDTKKLRQKILDLAIHGKLVPQDPNDEPASVLLERIRKEKEQLIKEGKIKSPKKSKSAGDTSHYPKEGPWELPKGWVWLSGEDIFLPMESTSPKGEFFEYIDIDAIDNATNCIKKPKHLAVVNAPSRATRKVSKGDVLFSMVRPYLRNIAMVELDSCIASTGFYVCRCSEILDSKYCYYLMLSNYVVEGLNQFMKGDNSPSINNTHITSWIYPIPPLSEQKRISGAIDGLLTYVGNLEGAMSGIVKCIDEVKSKLLDLAIHGKLVPQDPSDEPAIELLKRINPAFKPSDNLHYEEVLPEGWVLVPLSSICSTINGLWKGSKEPLIKVGVIRNANFTKDFTLDYSKIEYIDVELKSFEKRHLEDGDIIVEKSGGSDNFPVGRSIIYQGSNKVYSFSNFTMSLRITDKQQIAPEYLFYVLQHRYRRGDMKQMQTQTTGLHNLLSDIYLSMLIPIPPVNEQERIVVAIKESFQLLDRIRDVVKDTK